MLVPNSPKHPPTLHPYLLYFLYLSALVFITSDVISLSSKKVHDWLSFKGRFITMAFILLSVYNLVTKKFAAIPVIYFPKLDRIFAVIVEERAFLSQCLLSSGKLLLTGYVFGAIAGFATGIGVGFLSSVDYWISPIIRLLGPIPSTAWIPIVLISFPTTFSASAFLIALAVWFPTCVMTSSGIANINIAYFEVSSTLGASRFYQVARVGIPAAMPHMFIGLFSGTCSSFITLMTAEMIGVKNGIGWYVNWQREMLSYANAYAGLIIIAVTFSVLIKLLFTVRDKLLSWQKEVVKW
jgi:NitT/TauT family transport system permease protein